MGASEGPPLGSVGEMAERGLDLLEAGDPLHAIEWLQAAERQALAAGDEAALCGLLGDKAVAFRRMGNLRRAKESYVQAIEFCRRQGDDLNLSRWTGNLGGLQLQEGDQDGAEASFREEMGAAVRTADPDQVSVAVGNLALVLGGQERFSEAVEAVESALGQVEGGGVLEEILRSNSLALAVRWAAALSEEGQLTEALGTYQKAIGFATNDDDGKRAAAAIHRRMADLHERLMQGDDMVGSLDEAISLFRDVGDEDQAKELETLRDRASGAIPPLA